MTTESIRAPCAICCPPVLVGPRLPLVSPARDPGAPAPAAAEISGCSLTLAAAPGTAGEDGTFSSCGRDGRADSIGGNSQSRLAAATPGGGIMSGRIADAVPAAGTGHASGAGGGSARLPRTAAGLTMAAAGVIIFAGYLATPYGGPRIADRVIAFFAAAPRGSGRRLVVSDKTVRNHVSAVLTKLQVASRAEAVALARDAGLGTAGGPG